MNNGSFLPRSLPRYLRLTSLLLVVACGAFSSLSYHLIISIIHSRFLGDWDTSEFNHSGDSRKYGESLVTNTHDKSLCSGPRADLSVSSEIRTTSIPISRQYASSSVICMWLAESFLSSSGTRQMLPWFSHPREDRTRSVGSIPHVTLLLFLHWRRRSFVCTFHAYLPLSAIAGIGTVCNPWQVISVNTCFSSLLLCLVVPRQTSLNVGWIFLLYVVQPTNSLTLLFFYFFRPFVFNWQT